MMERNSGWFRSASNCVRWRRTSPTTFWPLKDRISELVTSVAGVSTDLQELSRGIHPAILSKGGLGPALKTLARRSAVPVELVLAVNDGCRTLPRWPPTTL